MSVIEYYWVKTKLWNAQLGFLSRSVFPTSFKILLNKEWLPETDGCWNGTPVINGFLPLTITQYPWAKLLNCVWRGVMKQHMLLHPLRNFVKISCQIMPYKRGYLTEVPRRRRKSVKESRSLIDNPQSFLLGTWMEKSGFLFNLRITVQQTDW